MCLKRQHIATAERAKSILTFDRILLISALFLSLNRMHDCFLPLYRDHFVRVHSFHFHWTILFEVKTKQNAVTAVHSDKAITAIIKEEYFVLIPLDVVKCLLNGKLCKHSYIAKNVVCSTSSKLEHLFHAISCRL